MPPPVKSFFIQDFNRLKSSLLDGLKLGLPAKGYFWLGLFLLMALMIQQSIGWRWAVLTKLQGDGTYKLATGIGLLAFLLYQWCFSVKRAQGEQGKVAAMLSRHKQIGTLLPLVFLGHSQSLGYGYVGTLSLTVLLVHLTGLFNAQIIHIRKAWYRPAWITAHVGLSMTLLLIMGYHVYINYAFK